MARIAGVQRSLSSRVTSNLINLEVSLQQELDEVLSQEETLWYQKSRVECVRL